MATKQRLSAQGFAVVVNGEIDVKTVSPTERAAKVNALVTNGIMVLNNASDEAIAIAFDQILLPRGMDVIPVKITGRRP